MLRRQVEDVEKSKEDMVREYEQQLKKFQEEVSCKMRSLVSGSQMVMDQLLCVTVFVSVLWF